jgi:hypothetical protein
LLSTQSKVLNRLATKLRLFRKEDIMAKIPKSNSLLNESSGNARTAKTLSGRGTVSPGYTLIGTGKGKAKNTVAQAKIVKRVSPQDGLAPGKVGAGGRYANMNAKVVSVPVRRVARAAKANQGSNVVRPPKTALRVMTGRGTGAVRTV